MTAPRASVFVVKIPVDIIVVSDRSTFGIACQNRTASNAAARSTDCNLNLIVMNPVYTNTLTRSIHCDKILAGSHVSS
jgi:hypothetical protein